MPLIWGNAGVLWPGGAGLVRCAFVLVGPRVLSGTCHHWSIMNFFGYVSGQSSFFIHRKGHFCNLAEIRILERNRLFLKKNYSDSLHVQNTGIISSYIGLVIFFLLLRIFEQKSNEK